MNLNQLLQTLKEFKAEDDGDDPDYEGALDEIEDLPITEAIDDPEAFINELENEFGVSIDTENIHTIGDLIDALHQ